MSNIVHLLPVRGQTRNPAKDRAVRADRARAIRAVLNENRPMLPADQMMAAEAVWRLLDRLHGQGIVKAQVLQAAGIAQASDSTKHLGQYALNPSRLRGGTNAARLNKKPRAYVAILTAAAKLAGTDPDDALLEVFGATSLAASSAARSATPEYEEMARRLREIVEAVAVKHDLQTYFNDVLRAGVSLYVSHSAEEENYYAPKPEDIEIDFRRGSLPLDWPISFYDFNNDFRHHDCDNTVPPYPSVILGDWDVGEPCRLHFDFEEGLNGEDPIASPMAATVEGQYHAELRLCIVPAGSDLRPEPALRVKVGLFCTLPNPASPSGDLYPTIEGWIPTTTPRSTMSVATKDSPARHCRIWTDGSDLPAPIQMYFPQKDLDWRGGCLFLPITGLVAQDWLELDILSTFGLSAMDMPAHIRVLGHHLLQFAFGDDFSPFRSGTIASGLDHCLSGKQGTNPLDLLDACAGQLAEFFGDASMSARADRDTAMARLDARLRQIHDSRQVTKE